MTQSRLGLDTSHIHLIQLIIHVQGTNVVVPPTASSFSPRDAMLRPAT